MSFTRHFLIIIEVIAHGDITKEETYWDDKNVSDRHIADQIMRYYDAKLKIDKLVAEMKMYKLTEKEELPVEVGPFIERLKEIRLREP